ncbi:hypothetical protein, partial [Mycoplasma sp. CB776]
GTFNGQSDDGRTEEQYETTVTEATKKFKEKQDAAKTTIEGLSYLSEAQKTDYKNQINSTLTNENENNDISSIDTILGNARAENTTAEELAQAKLEAISIANKLKPRNDDGRKEEFVDAINNQSDKTEVEKLKEQVKGIIQPKIDEVQNKLDTLIGLDEGGNQTKAYYDVEAAKVDNILKETTTEKALDTLITNMTIAYDNIFDSVQTAINNLPNDA